MNKHINFEDNIFILNVRIRMLRDLLSLDADPGLFLEKTLEDLQFIDNVLEALVGNLIENPRLLDRELEFDNLSDLEWQFGQLLTEFMRESNPFSTARFPEIRERIVMLKDTSAGRRKIIDEASAPSEPALAEPVVSPLELSELLRGF